MVTAFVVVTLLGSQLFLRVELGLLVGSVATVAVMSVLLVPLLRSHVRAVEANELFVAVPPAEV